MIVSTYKPLQRTFADDNAAALTAWGVDVDEFTSHLYRRTTAACVERPAGITLGLRLFGHPNEQITRASYGVCADEVDPIIDILDEVLGS